MSLKALLFSNDIMFKSFGLAQMSYCNHYSDTEKENASYRFVYKSADNLVTIFADTIHKIKGQN